MSNSLTRGGARAGAAWVILAGTLMANAGMAQAQTPNVDLVVTMEAGQPAYMVQETEHYTVTVSNNGPAAATNVSLVVTHPLADQPFEASATCQPVPGPNPNGSAVCPAGSATAPSAAFVRSGDSFNVTIPSIPSQSMVRVQFQNASRCDSSTEQAGAPRCFMPGGNYTLSAEVSSPQNETDPGTNRATTNIFLYPPDSQYRIQITQAPASAVPGQVVDYEFEVTSMGLNLSHMLTLGAELRGLAGDMTPMSSTNAPFGALSSTLPGTRLLSIDCLSMSLGAYPASQVFPASPSAWQACPTSGQIPIPQPISGNNSMPVRGFDSAAFLDNLPGTQSGPATGGVMRFRARVEVGEPVCVAVPESGYRELEMKVNVIGMPGTDLVAPGAADNTDIAITQVAANCQEADIQFITTSTPAAMTLDGSGQAHWTQTTTVSNISSGITAGTATQVPVEFGHRSLAFSQTRTALSCSSVPAGLCPNAAELLAGVTVDTTTAYRFSGTLAALPPGAVVTFSQDVVLERTACWSGVGALVNLSGHALPSPALFDPNYNPTVISPPDFTPGVNAFLGNNGLQTVASVDGLTPCPGGGGEVPTGALQLLKTGPYASAADAAAAGPLIGQTPATAIADGTQLYFNLTVRNPDAVATAMLHQINDWNFGAMGLQAGDSGFVHSGPLLADWGISCSGSPSSAPCHELATSLFPDGYVRSFQLEYDPALHGGTAEAALAPLASLTYIVPFTTPAHMNRCHGPTQVQNRAQAQYQLANGAIGSTPQSVVNYYVGGPDCVPGNLHVEKEILAPATASHIPTSGLLSFRLTLTNQSATETLDIARLVDQPSVNGVQVSVASITCNSLSGGAQCPTTTILPGTQTMASGVTAPLSDPLRIDHEWGSVGNATFPPGSSLELIVTYQLSEPTRGFSCFGNRAEFTGENDINGWVPDDDQVWVCPPAAPELSLQKKVDLQIVGPDAWVTYTLIVTNIGAASADGALLQDPMPANLQAANPTGFSNITCTDITASSSIPNPHGTVVCPAVINGPSGMSATIATLGPNTALRFTYQARMPDQTLAPVSVANVAMLVSPSPGGLSFGSGAVQSHQNVQVIAAAGAPTTEVTMVPVLGSRWLLLMVLAVFVAGLWRVQMRPV